MYLMTPGPSECDPRILETLAQPSPYHRDPAFMKLYFETHVYLKQIFQTQKGEVCIFNGSGTLGMDLSVCSFFQKEDAILVISVGQFGDRFVEIAHTYGMSKVHVIQVPWGESYNLKEVEALMHSIDELKGVFVTHSETSTGVLNELAAIGQLCHDLDILFIVDTISGLIMNPFAFDEWHVDVAIAASQKGFSMPAGLCMMCLSQKAIARLPKQDVGYYLGIRRTLTHLQQKTIFTTVNTPYIVALHYACRQLLHEGLPQVQARYAQSYARLFDTFIAQGYQPFPKASASKSLLVFYEQPNQNLVEKMKAAGILIAKGMQAYQDKVFRIGNMNYIESNVVEQMMEIIKGAKDE